MPRFEGAATPRADDSADVGVSKRRTLSRPSSQPTASQPCSGFHERQCRCALFGIAIFLESIE